MYLPTHGLDDGAYKLSNPKQQNNNKSKFVLVHSTFICFKSRRRETITYFTRWILCTRATCMRQKLWFRVPPPITVSTQTQVYEGSGIGHAFFMQKRRALSN